MPRGMVLGACQGFGLCESIPRLLALHPWAEQIVGLEPVRANWLKQAS